MFVFRMSPLALGSCGLLSLLALFLGLGLAYGWFQPPGSGARVLGPSFTKGNCSG